VAFNFSYVVSFPESVHNCITYIQHGFEKGGICVACSGRGRATKLAPSQQKATVRRDEMQLLYGVGAAMIQGMETAMQLTFDRNTDRLKPRPWPALPLNIQFSKASNE
jgi:Gemini of Cajal bodies-associated protein 8